MSMQVTSSTVATTQTDLNPTSTGGVGDTAPTSQSSSTGVQLPPQYQLNFGGLTRALGLGLSTPSSVGDVEILFARIASELKETLAEVNSLERIGQSESRRGDLGLAMAAFDQMVRWGEEVDTNRANIKVQEGIIATESQNLSRQQGELQTLEGSRGSLVEQRDNKQTEMDTLIAQNKPENAARIAQLSNEIGGLNSQILSLDSDISAKKTEIQLTQDKIDTASASKKRSEDRIDTLLALAASFFENFVSLFLLALGGTKAEMARDAAFVMVEGDSFEAILARVASSLVEVGASITDLIQGSQTAEQSVGSGLNMEQSAPDRFGQPSAPVARAMAFAGMVAGTMGAIADLLRNFSAGLAMQNAGSFASAGDARVRVPV